MVRVLPKEVLGHLKSSDTRTSRYFRLLKVSGAIHSNPLLTATSEGSRMGVVAFNYAL